MTLIIIPEPFWNLIHFFVGSYVPTWHISIIPIEQLITPRAACYGRLHTDGEENSATDRYKWLSYLRWVQFFVSITLLFLNFLTTFNYHCIRLKNRPIILFNFLCFNCFTECIGNISLPPYFVEYLCILTLIICCVSWTLTYWSVGTCWRW